MKGPKTKRAVDRDRIWRLHLQGLPAAAIAECLGCSRRVVHRAIQVLRQPKEAAA